MTLVKLTWREMRLGGQAGIERRVMDLYNGSRDRYDAPSLDHGWEIDVQGALGEMAVAKFLGLYWSGDWPRKNGDGDVARHQVRTTTRPDGCLIIHPDDPDEVPFILVIVSPPNFRIAGWMAGAAAKQDRYWRSEVRTPAFFVPQMGLCPIDEFVAVPGGVS